MRDNNESNKVEKEKKILEDIPKIALFIMLVVGIYVCLTTLAFNKDINDSVTAGATLGMFITSSYTIIVLLSSYVRTHKA